MSGERSRAGAVLVGSGILLSRLAGLVRQKVFAHYFSTSIAADAFNAAFRIPNMLQNLFGEGVLSASFIPVYAGLLARRQNEDANRVAGAVISALALVASVLVLLGVIAAPLLVDVIAPGFTGERRELTVQLTRILFPGAALLVFGAWCLGILNSHRRFFMSYASPVAWNLVMIGALLVFAPGRTQGNLVVILAWASVLGSALQFLVQLPLVLRLTAGVRPNTAFRSPEARAVFRNFGPVFVGRGVVQISAFIDSFIASWLPTGAVAVVGYAQVLYTLPVSLFGMAVSAAELPVMSSAVGTTDEVAAYLRGRLDAGLERIAFFIVPSAVAFLALGDVIAALLFQSGRFTQSDTVWVWQVLAGSTIGLLAATWGRLYSSTFYALRDTRTPLRFAVARVALNLALGAFLALWLPRALGLDARVGAAGLTAASGLAAWVEFFLLRRALSGRIGKTSMQRTYTVRLWGAALFAALIASSLRLIPARGHTIWMGLAILGVYGLAYFGATLAIKVPEAAGLRKRITRQR